MLQTGLIKFDFLEKVFSGVTEKVVELGFRVIGALILLFIGSKLIKLLRKIVKNAMTKAEAEVGAIQFMDSFLRIALYVLLAFSIATSFGLDAASIVALLGSAGVAIGLALQGSLSNLAGGILLLVLKPFVVGDYIVSHGAGQEGVVTEIQIFYTKLTTVDNRNVIIPNGVLANNSITNVTAQDSRRIDVTVGISYQADLKQAKDALQEMLNEQSLALEEKEKTVFVADLGASSVVLNMRCWCKKEDYWDCKAAVTENAKLALDAAGIEIPFNQIDVHMK
ncbi:MAG: mechanosensitive ion channel family protein [Lachnospiraceae bacterium]|nr:mechanosensitive ion channel family protein [Lachnospiraceae bacterium]